jgi:hypothetical protein
VEDESGRSVQEPPADRTLDTAAPDTGAPAPKRALPPWAWAVVILAAGLVIAGAGWSLYESGRSAGLRDAAGGGEATGTASGETTATGDTSVAMMPTESTPPEEPVEAPADEQAAGDPPPADYPAPSTPNPPPSNTVGPLRLIQPKDPNISELYPIPTTWKVLFKHSNTGPWEMPNPPGAPLKSSYLRVTVLATDNANNSGYVQLKRVDGGKSLPNYGILYDWADGSGSVIYKVLDPVFVDGGLYQLRVSIHGPWTIMIEQ